MIEQATLVPHIPALQPVFPPSLALTALSLIDLLDDADVDSCGICGRHQIILDLVQRHFAFCVAYSAFTFTRHLSLLILPLFASLLLQ